MLVPKLFTVLKDYNREQFVKDLIAGIVVGIIAIPLSIALAIASGVSPEKGLHTAIIAGFLISFLGGSRVQIGGPTGAFVIIIYGVIEQYGMSGLIMATIMAGILLIIMGLCKFGSMIKFIPYPITTGFTSGIALVIFSQQIKDFFGLKMDSVPSEFIEKWSSYFEHMDTIQWESLLMGTLTLIIIAVWPKINKRIPGSLIAIIITTVLSLLFGLNVETIGSRFGEISAALPMPVLPDFDLGAVKELIQPAVTIALLIGIESLLSAVVADGMIGSRHRSNMELVAQGIANIASAIFGGIPATGAIARTAANIKNGGRTPIAGMVHALVLLVTLLVFMPYTKLIPLSTLAAILIVVSYNMSEWRAFKGLLKAPKSDVAVLLITFTLTVVIDLVVAIEIGMVLAALLFMKRMADVTQVKAVTQETNDWPEPVTWDEGRGMPCENIQIYEINGPFFFGAASKFVEITGHTHKSYQVLILEMKSVPAMDATAYHALKKLAASCMEDHIKLLLVHVQPQPRRMLEKVGFINCIDKESLCESIEEAIAKANGFIEGMNEADDQTAAVNS